MQSMNISLPDSLKTFVDGQIAQGPGGANSGNQFLAAIGIDLGGQGAKTCVFVGGKEVTDEIFPEQSNEEESKAQDASLRFNYAFDYNHLEEGGSGIEFKERLIAFIKKVVEAIEVKYGAVRGVFINMAGAPDFAHDRMASMGNLSRGFDKKDRDPQDELAQANGFIPQLRGYLSNKNIAFGYGNDMTGWSLSIAQEAGLKDVVAIITGSGIGVKLVLKGQAVDGANECGHLILFVTDGVKGFKLNFCCKSRGHHQSGIKAGTALDLCPD